MTDHDRCLAIDVAPAERRDIEVVEAIFAEMDSFYGTPDPRPVRQRRAEVADALFGPRPNAEALLARRGVTLVGIAAYSFLWPAVGTTRSLYLKELFVREPARGTGVGRALLHRLREVAVEVGCSRLEWHADRDNQRAQEFYGRFCTPDPPDRRLRYRLEGADLLSAHQRWPRE